MTADARRRRLRAVLFAAAALLTAGAAALVADGYGSRVAGSYGPLRPVVVAADRLGAGEVIGPDEVTRSLVLRSVPSRFVPPGALGSPEQALGLQPLAPIPAGAYVLGLQLRPPRRARTPRPGLSAGRRPVEIAVTGARALLAAGPPVAGAPVDVLVTTEPEGTGPGRTYVAAARVPLLALQAGQGGGAAATLGLTRPQALELISAENFARGVRLLPAGGAP
jgi:Flp pilus assembly protein CpaB